MHDLSEALLAQATPASSALLYLIMVFLICGIVWASRERVDEVTQADARVIPSNREQIVNSLEGGVLSELFVNEGQTVEAGQPLAQLEPTRFGSQYQEGISRQLTLKAARARASRSARDASAIPARAERTQIPDRKRTANLPSKEKSARGVSSVTA